MGFVTFEALRQPYRHALVSASSMPADTAWLDAQRDTSDLGSAYVDAAKNALSIVSTSLERQTLAELEAVADLLVQADRVYLTAVRASYALAYYLHYVGRMALPSIALIPRHRNSAMDDLVDATPSDVLIAISVTPYSRETIEACAFAQKRGGILILIADSEVVSPDLTPKHTLVASVLSTHKFGCFTGMMAVLELLIAILMRRGGADAEDRIEAYDNHRTANHAYWSTQKKH